MWHKKYLLTLTVICISIGLTSNLTNSHIDLDRKLQESAKKEPKFKPSTYLDLNDKEAMEEVFRKIENYKSLESNQIRHLTLSEIEEEKNLNKLRNLDEDNTFENVGLIDPKSNLYYISAWIYRTMNQYSSNIVLYPYYFNYTHEIEKEKDNETITVNETIHYRQGAYVSLNSTELDFYGNIGLKTNGTFKTKKAKAVFAGDFAILSIKYSQGYYDEESFQDGVDWSTYFSAYARGNTFETYQEFLEQKEKDTSKTYVTKINETEVINGNLLNEDGLPRFGILIIPDYQLGTDSIILSKLGDDGKNNIKKFYEKGGKIIVDGKSGALLEDLGLMTSGVYDRDKLLSVNNVDRKVRTKGCESTFNKLYDSEDDDFEKQMVCLTVDQGKKITLATSFKTSKKADGYSTLMELDSNDELLVTTDVNDGLTYNLTDEEKEYNPLILFKKNKKNGQIFVLNYNPVHEGGDRNIVLNVIVRLLSKELYLTSTVKMNHNSDNNKDVPIPAGEFDYNLQVNILIHNLDDKEMKNSILYIFLPDNFDWDEIPSECTKKTYNKADIPSSVAQRKTFENENDYLYCNLGTIPIYHKSLLDVYITVLNYKATQLKYQVLLLEPILTYKDSNNEENLLFDQIKTNCEAAALIRTSLNPDPSSFYPLQGIGDYVDNVLKIENKEETLAYEVEYYALIPLISPLVDGCDQSKTTWTLQLYDDYYNSLHDFEVPLTSGNATDYIIPAELKGKGAVIAAEWDGPVLPTKELYNGPSTNVGEEITELRNINNGLVTVNSTTEVIKQINYRISDRLYKLASQRLMVFIDTTTTDGAKAIYKGVIPDEIKDPKYNDRTKVDFLYSRLDIFFYNNSNYYNPGNASQQLVFSVDKYREYKKNAENCAKKFGQASSKKVVNGYFTNLNKSKKDPILKPNEYSNALFDYCDITLIDPTEEKIDIGNNGDYKLIHYIIPNVEENITLPKQLYNFTQIDEYNGYHNNYTSIKFLYVHSLEYTIKSEYCKYGGKMKIDLGEFKISSTDDITISPDHIAVYKTEYEEKSTNSTITIYFKRGLMSNEQFGKNAKIRINLENLMKNDKKDHANHTFTFILEELKYDISSPETEYEKYSEKTREKVDFYYTSAFSYPALEIVAKMDRELNGYETLEPFNRYGLYIQELWHRTLYAPAENHHETDPGVTGSGDGFSVISNLGTSSIPMIEYMSVGKGQVIPAGPTTSRVSWKDVWGRKWQQPLRTVFPDIPPVPPPVKNFMMTTTFEIIRYGKQIYDWVSDEDVLVHLHIKLLNNYPKYFEITRCKENEIRFVPYSIFESHDREYENKSTANLTAEELNGDNMFLRQGGMASYGVCYSDERAYVSGSKVEGKLLEQIEQAKLCADYTDANEIQKCAEKLADIKTISRAPDNITESEIWNYSPLVKDYYPDGYIEADMWQMTHVDYYDTPMDKAYKYHCDNVLPNYDSFDFRFESPNIIKPQNSINIPLYKGLGYNLVYNKTYSMNYHGKIRSGWWSDNLQNKDDTLLAGRNECNNISVNKESQIKWVDGVDLVGSKRSGSDEAAKKIISNKQKNIYTCLFNRKRPQYKPNSGKSFHPRNVVENNIVPIIVDLDRYDKRLTEYNCTGYQYSPDNISTFEENYLETPTSKDYLYFAANLRGHAKEAFNIIVKLEKFDKIKYEGDVKINEGGRFVYWNPVNGPNSFLVVDDPVNIIKGKRNDIEIENNLFPLKLKTFNSVLYHAYTFKDENKINTEWPYSTYYTNSYGYGDIAVSVYVGGVRKSKPVLHAKETTYARIIIYNNCGFDLNLKANAIEFDYRGSEPINADDLLKNITHSIKAPTKYNFLSYEVEEEYSQYIQIRPSDHNIDVAPEFFDFENINVATIRDGFKGEYSLQINVTENFPDDLTGKPIEIKIKLNKTYFDKFPGYKTDPTGNYHNYDVEIPSVYIAVPNEEGKVYYTTCRASNLNVTFKVGVDWNIDGIKYITFKDFEEFSNATQQINYTTLLNEKWDELESRKNISYTETTLDENYKRIMIDGIKEEFDYFPKKILHEPDIAEAIIIVRSSISQLTRGTIRPITDIAILYNDWIEKKKISTCVAPTVEVTGAWIELTYSRKLVEYLGDGKYAEKPDQSLYPDESGLMKVQFKLTNTGNGNSYNTKYEITLEPNLDLFDSYTGANKIESKKLSDGRTILSFDYGSPILAKELKGGILYLNYYNICDTSEIITQEQKDKIPKALNITKKSDVYMDLTQTEGENPVVQHLRKFLSMDYSFRNDTSVYLHLDVTGKRKNPTNKIKPKIKLGDNITTDDLVMYIGKLDETEYEEKTRNLLELDEFKYETIYNKGPVIEELEDKPIQKDYDNKKHKVSYTINIYDKNNKLLCSNKITYDQTKIGISKVELTLIIISVVFYLAAIFFIWIGIRICRKPVDLEKTVYKSKFEKLVSFG